ncbi:MAG: flagellar hook-associated protein FlgK, partial [Gammaproteobacteria bacterium]|nr:flagellar hook-associated protein FlgK [Gammaproteobacteria bacterium]
MDSTVVSILDIGSSALRAQQLRLATASHNIANASTEGYHRQRVETSAMYHQGIFGTNPTGMGVEVDRVARLADGIVNGQLRESLSAMKEGESSAKIFEEIELLLTGAGDGLRAGFSEFFDAAHELAGNPTSSAAREQFFQRLDQLADGVNSISSKLNVAEQGAEAIARDEVTELNTMLRDLAQLNAQINTGKASGAAPDMLDERDLLLDKISERIGVSVMIQPDQSVRLYTSGGQPLVNEATANQLSLEQVNGEFALKLQVATSSVDITKSTSGGSIMGVLNGGFDMIDDVRTSLGRLATVFVESANEINRMGLDASGQPAGNLFKYDPVVSEPFVENNGSATISASISDLSQLEDTRYELLFDGANWDVINDEGIVVGNLSATGGQIDGLDVTISAGAAVGDRMRIDAVTNIFDSLEVVPTKSSMVAVAHMVSGSAGLSNQGSVNLVDVRAQDSADPNLYDDVRIRFDTPTSYEMVDSDGNVLQASQPYVVGQTIQFNGWSAEVNGNPVAGDFIMVYGNAGGQADNRNAVAFANLEDSKIFGGGKRGFVDEFANLVTKHGTQMAANKQRTESAQ